MDSTDNLGSYCGCGVGAGLYLLNAAITGTFSINGLGRSLMMGAITGGIGGGLGQVFSTSGFWGTVANGAISGAGTGGVTSIINGQNFIEGLTRGAVFGGAMAGVSWMVNETAHYYKQKGTVSSIAKDDFEAAGYDTSDVDGQNIYKDDKEMIADFNTTTGDYNASAKAVKTNYQVATNKNLPYGYKLSGYNSEIISTEVSDSKAMLGVTFDDSQNWFGFIFNPD